MRITAGITVLVRSLVLWAAASGWSAAQDLSGAISNPYYAQRQWQVWSLDGTENAPSELKFKQGDERLLPEQLAVLPANTDESVKYAGMWDDVYVSQDNYHSSIYSYWQDDSGRRISIAGQLPILKRGYYQFQVRGNTVSSPATAELKSLGANFTSQSTNGMGHDIANHPLQMLVLEREFYFANILRSGPAHVSYREHSDSHSEDQYQALVPCFYNSIGSSGSETWALTKMVIAGANLSESLKRGLKRHGLYPSTLLYLWKAALPYDVPYAHELRHRVAYFSDGDDREQKGKLQADMDSLSHAYDDSAHLQNMVRLARELKAAPPIALLSRVRSEGGKLHYGLRTSALVVQDDEDVVVEFSTSDSYDILGLPVEVQVTQLCGNPATRIEETSDGEFQITVPFDSQLPRGRTSLAVVANNGQTDGNPAIINVFNAAGQPNQRPDLTIKDRYVVAPGRTLKAEIDVMDPEGFPVTIAKRSEQPGTIIGNTFTWTCPAETPEGKYPVTLIASDNTSGSSFRSVQLPIEVRTVIAQLDSSVQEGPAPLEVKFSAQRSADVGGGQLTYKWDFGDGQSSMDLAPAHRFDRPGYYQVRLTVEGPTGSDTAQAVIHARHDWPLLLENGWDFVTVLPGSWKPTGPEVGAVVTNYDGQRAMRVTVKKQSHERKAMEFVKQCQPPCFVDIEFFRAHNVPGVGFEFFGALFGRGQASPPGAQLKFVDDLSFSQWNPDTKQVDVFPLGDIPKTPTGPLRLRLYISPDLVNPENLVFRGYLSTGGTEEFFAIEDRPFVDSGIAILGGQMGSQYISKFKIWHPGR